MAKTRLIHNSFNAGEISPVMYGRQDFPRYQNGVETLENWFLQTQGGVSRRWGTKYIADAKVMSSAVRIIPFEFSSEVFCLIELGHLYIRIHRISPAGASVDVSTGLTLYSASEIFEVQYAQSADVIYLTHANHPVRKLSRLASDSSSWSVKDVVFTPGPSYEKEQYPAVTLAMAAISGAGAKMRAGDNYFLAADVDKTIQVGDSRAVIKTIVAGEREITADILDSFPAGQIVAGLGNVQNIASVPGVGNISGAGTTITTSAPHGLTLLDVGDQCRSDAGPTVGEIKNIEEILSATTFRINSAFTVDPGGVAWTLLFVAPQVKTSVAHGLLPANIGDGVIPSAGAAIGQIRVAVAFPATDRIRIDEAFGADPGGVAWNRGVHINSGAWQLVGSPSSKLTSDKTGPVGAIATLTLATAGWRNTDATKSWGVSDIGRYVKAMGGYLRITAYTSTTVVSAEILSTLSSAPTTAPYETLAGTWTLEDAAWSSTAGYPAAVNFFEQRLWFAGSATKGQTIWGSSTGDYENFAAGTAAGDSVEYTIATNDLSPIRWLSSARVLLIGASGREFRASGGTGAISPTNIDIRVETSFGSPKRRPVQVGHTTIFVQRAGRKVRELEAIENIRIDESVSRLHVVEKERVEPIAAKVAVVIKDLRRDTGPPGSGRDREGMKGTYRFIKRRNKSLNLLYDAVALGAQVVFLFTQLKELSLGRLLFSLLNIDRGLLFFFPESRLQFGVFLF